MTFENNILINATRDQIFRIYADVENWNKWDPEVKASHIKGKFSLGVLGTLTPNTGPTANIEIVDLIPNQSFTVQSKLPLCVMKFEHQLFEVKENIKVVHRVTFTGKLSFLFSRLIGKSIKKGLPRTLQGLKEKVESIDV